MQNVIQALQAQKCKIAGLQKADGPFVGLPPQVAAKSQQQVAIICRVLDDAVRALEAGRDINGRPISPAQVSAGLQRLIADSRKPQFLMTLSMTMSNDSIRQLESCMNEVETLLKDVY